MSDIKSREELLTQITDFAAKRNKGKYYEAGDKAKVEEGFYGRWKTGGARGGDCWGGEAQEIEGPGESEAELDGLDVFLELVKPDITFLQYKRLLSKVERGEYTEDDYYRNYTTYGTKLLRYEDVVAVLGDILQLPAKPVKKNSAKGRGKGLDQNLGDDDSNKPKAAGRRPKSR